MPSMLLVRVIDPLIQPQLIPPAIEAVRVSGNPVQQSTPELELLETQLHRVQVGAPSKQVQLCVGLGQTGTPPL
jgi:hypothetical protein